MSDFEHESEIEVVETRILKRLTVKNFFASFLEAFNLERGLIFTLKRLFTAPGLLVRDFIGAGRLKYIGPFKLLLVSTTLALLAMTSLESFNEAQVQDGLTSSEGKVLMKQALEDLQAFINVFLWIYIPIAAFFSWRLNNRKRTNYAENLAFHTYYFVISNIVSMLLFLDFMLPMGLILAVSGSLFLIYYVWMYKQFFQKSWWRSALELTLTYTVGSFFYAIVAGGFLVAYVVIFLRT